MYNFVHADVHNVSRLLYIHFQKLPACPFSGRSSQRKFRLVRWPSHTLTAVVLIVTFLNFDAFFLSLSVFSTDSLAFLPTFFWHAIRFVNLRFVHVTRSTYTTH